MKTINDRLGQLPWQAIVLAKDAENKGKICGGAIVSRFHVLTAAHCVEKERRKFVGPINVGQVSLSINDKVVNYDVEKVIVHPKRSLKSLINDLAVIKVTVPFNFSKNIQPIPIGNLSVDRLHENEKVNVLFLHLNISF